MPQCTKLAGKPPTARRSWATSAGTGTPALAVPGGEVVEIGLEARERGGGLSAAELGITPSSA